MKILHSRTFRGVTTGLYTNGVFSCSCPDFRQIGSGHCEHTRELLKERIAFNAPEHDTATCLEMCCMKGVTK